MVKISRSTPPIPLPTSSPVPVRAGWLFESILNAAHQPLLISTIPAFSPGPCTRHSPSVGSRSRWLFDDLYEKLSAHISAKIIDSVRFGSRPMNSRMSDCSAEVNWYSAEVKCLILISGPRLRFDVQVLDHGEEESPSIIASEDTLRCPFRVGHQPENISRLIADTGDALK